MFSDFGLFQTAYGIIKEGNFEGRNLLQRRLTDLQLAEMTKLPIETIHEKLAQMRRVLLDERTKRSRPAVDDKILVSWNALALISFSEAARYLNDDHYLQIAQKNADFLLQELFVDGQLFRSWRKRKAQNKAGLEDYAGLALALLNFIPD